MLYVLTSLRGALLRWSTTPAGLQPIPADAVVVEREAWEAPPPLPYVWSPAHRDWVIETPQPTLVVSKLAFRWRYTLAEQVAIARAEAEHPDPNMRATLRILRESLQEADEIRLDDPRTVQGVGLHAQLGLITEARAAEILTP
jgi:hypothetical protein